MTTREDVLVEEEGCAQNCSSGVLSSSSSCISEVDMEPSDEDRQLLSLLDAMDHLLCSRDSFAKSLSQGWIAIASARYSMGPSRINQALFSLKPCPASTVVSVSTLEDVVQDEGHGGEGEQEQDIQYAFQFALQNQCKSDQDNNTAFGEENANLETQSHLRQRHISGFANKQHADDDSEGSVNHLLANESIMAEERHRHPKQRSDALAWFGTLVSPHLRAAQTSFTEALETLVDLAMAQNKVLAAYHQIKRGGGLV
eukprot:c18735_g1_i1 orf=80-847(+)